jgi:hypothetical protein
MGNYWTRKEKKLKNDTKIMHSTMFLGQTKVHWTFLQNKYPAENHILWCNKFLYLSAYRGEKGVKKSELALCVSPHSAYIAAYIMYTNMPHNYCNYDNRDKSIITVLSRMLSRFYYVMSTPNKTNVIANVTCMHFIQSR